MKRRLIRILLAIAAIGTAAAALWYATRPEPVAVRVSLVETGKVESSVANTRAGTVKACRRARIAPTMGGQVAALLVKKGDRVAAGQPLLELWNKDLAAQLKLARSEAGAARARSEEACVLAEMAARDHQRVRKLHSQGLATEERLDQSASDASARRAACAAAKANAQVSRDRIAVARATLDRTILTAPFAGTVAEITGEVGEFITPSPPGIPTPPAVDLIDTTCLYVTAPIDEVDAPAVRTGMPARITLDAFRDRQFAGRVQRIAPYVLEVEKQARTVEVEVAFADPGEIKGLLPGYSADAEIILDTRDRVLRVPTEALLEGNRVLVYRPSDGLLEERHLKTGLSNWRYTEVVEGLRAGERVVTSVDRKGVAAGVHATLERDETGRGP